MRAGFNDSGVSKNNRLLERHDSRLRRLLAQLRFCQQHGPAKPFRASARAQHRRRLLSAGRRRDDLSSAQRLASLHARGRQGQTHRQGAERNRRRSAPARSAASRPASPACRAMPAACSSRPINCAAMSRKTPRSSARRSWTPSAPPIRARHNSRPRSRRTTCATQGAGEIRRARSRSGAGQSRHAALRGDARWPTAAAELGLKVEELGPFLKGNPDHTRILGGLLVKGGTVQRATFQEHFPELARRHPRVARRSPRPKIKPKREPAFEGHTATVNAVAFSHDGAAGGQRQR